ncbi:MAG: GlmL-related ornithine degradation protein [Thermoanaerobacteraceae bacterium]|nr:GlmL-related ornithine degradation protein [Thermoanaerobacteraceae bacterium]
MLHIDLIVAEIGSTTTVVNAFGDMGSSKPKLIGQGYAPTTVLDGDVTIGLEKAVKMLEDKLGDKIKWERMMASSSAAGGLKMTVHGLVYDMTAKAAKEAALGAGAVLHLVTAGRLSHADLNKIREIKPNIILLAGGVDYGEKDTVINNGREIANLGMGTPVVYAGNIAARDEIKEIFDGKNPVFFVDNVYPRIDELNIEPTRRVIQEVFEKHIVTAPGMEKIRTMVDGRIIPTPGAVMNAARLLKEDIGDLMVMDVGGATTDVHSVTQDSDEIAKMLIAPEPEEKRTVEGDLGIYINRYHVLDCVGIDEAVKALSMDVQRVIDGLPPIPASEDEIRLAEYLTKVACKTAVMRHAGEIKYLYGPTGRYAIAQGKDLTKVKWIIGTGGALTRLSHGPEILSSLREERKGKRLLPTTDASILIDRDYIMAAAGVMTGEFPQEALLLMKGSLGIN